VGNIDSLDLCAKLVHFVAFRLDEVLVRVAPDFLCQDGLVGRFNALLQFKILFYVQSTEVFGTFEHNVLKQMGQTGLAAVFKG